MVSKLFKILYVFVPAAQLKMFQQVLNFKLEHLGNPQQSPFTENFLRSTKIQANLRRLRLTNRKAL